MVGRLALDTFSRDASQERYSRRCAFFLGLYLQHFLLAFLWHAAIGRTSSVRPTPTVTSLPGAFVLLLATETTGARTQIHRVQVATVTRVRM